MFKNFIIFRKIKYSPAVFAFYSLIFLIFLFLFVLCFDWKEKKGTFIFAMLDVGQGDSFFIQSPTGTQVLIDGGPPRRLLGSLAKVMPAFDRYIDAIIMTHPDTDHFGGFLEFLDFYDTGMFFQSGVATDSFLYLDMENKLKEKKILNILGRKGLSLDLGGGVFLDFLFPDRDVYDFETNSASLVTRLSYEGLSFLLTGDAGVEEEKLLLKSIDQKYLESVYLKAGHHGSKTSSSFEFVQAVSPKTALISAGKDNSYGHPDVSVLKTFNDLGVKVLRTDLSGTFVLEINSSTQKGYFLR